MVHWLYDIIDVLVVVFQTVVAAVVESLSYIVASFFVVVVDVGGVVEDEVASVVAVATVVVVAVATVVVVVVVAVVVAVANVVVVVIANVVVVVVVVISDHLLYRAWGICFAADEMGRRETCFVSYHLLVELYIAFVETSSEAQLPWKF